jgi:FtsP/CotA-like multicopper oxidase with cupredoxin domain
MDRSAGRAAIGAAWVVVAAMVAAIAGCTSLGTTAEVRSLDAERPLLIPPREEGLPTPRGRLFRLTADEGRTDFGQGGVADTIGLNGSYLGPTLVMRRGEQVRVQLRNRLSEMTTLHWHGMHVPARMDGGPHQMIAPGGTWTPTWRIDQPAASLWYHAHPHGRTAQQVYRGLAGMLLIEDPKSDGAPALPDDYGVDDVPLVVQDKSFTADGELVVDPQGTASTGFLGDTVVVNGTVAPYLDVTRDVLRLRLLNAANARVFSFGFGDGREFDIVASDGGLLARPVRADRVQLSPGERAEVLVRMRPGETVALASFPPDLGHGLGITHRYGGGTFDVLQLRAADTLAPGVAPPAELAPLPAAAEPAPGTRVRTFRISGRAINGRPMDMGRIDEVVAVGRPEVWEVMNADPQPHNFHVHDGSFRVLTVDGDPPAAPDAGLKDTVYVAPRSTVRLLVQFRDYTDPRWPYMYHCHLMWHEDIGVMGQFVVVGPGQEAGTPPEHGAHDG